MCHIQKLVYCVCAHTEMTVSECDIFRNKADKSERWKCIKPVCQHTRELFLHHGLCPSCTSHFNCGVSPTEAFIRRFWAYKSEKRMDTAVEAWMIPGEAIFNSDSTPTDVKPSACSSEEYAIMIAISRETERNDDCKECKTAKTVPLRRYAATAKRFVLKRAQEEDKNREESQQSASALEEKSDKQAPAPDILQDAILFNLDSTLARIFPEELLPRVQRRLDSAFHPELVPEPLVVPSPPRIPAVIRSVTPCHRNPHAYSRPTIEELHGLDNGPSTDKSRGGENWPL